MKKAEDIKLYGNWHFTICDAKTGKIKREYNYKNLIPTVGRTLIANNLANASPTNSMLVSHFALGTNATPPANADTKLGTEVFRNVIASRTNSSNIAYFSGYVPAPDDADTYKEAGIFCDGSLTADTGILLSHVAIDITKGLTETLTIDWTLTIS